MGAKLIKDYSKEELYLLREFIESFDNINTMKNEVDIMIYRKEKNEREFNGKLTIELMEKLHFFDSEVFDILRKHNIRNIQDLINSDLSKWNLTQQRRLELEEAKVWYDFSRLEEKDTKVNKKKK